MNTQPNRRAIIGAIATAPAAAIPMFAPASETDPIFALIERHRRAARAFEDAASMADEIEADSSIDALGEAESAAMEALLSTAPRTAAGVRAALQYLADFDEDFLPVFVKTLVAAPALAS